MRRNNSQPPIILDRIVACGLVGKVLKIVFPTALPGGLWHLEGRARSVGGWPPAALRASRESGAGGASYFFPLRIRNRPTAAVRPGRVECAWRRPNGGPRRRRREDLTRR